jgi:hypothetical protein
VAGVRVPGGAGWVEVVRVDVPVCCRVDGVEAVGTVGVVDPEDGADAPGTRTTPPRSGCPGCSIAAVTNHTASTTSGPVMSRTRVDRFMRASLADLGELSVTPR